MAIVMKRNGSGALLATLVLGLATAECGAATFTVDTDSDSGGGSLRERIKDANESEGPDVIEFDIPGAGVQTIKVLSALPTITDTLEIDGYTQSDATPNDRDRDSNAVIRIFVDGAGLDANGLSICAPDTVVRGLAIGNFGRGGISVGRDESSVDCAAGAADGTQILGNFIGMDADGNVAGNSAGIFVLNSTVTIGMGNAERNAIGDNLFGITLQGPGVAASVVEGNLIGLRPADGAALANVYGIALGSSAQALRIGSDDAPNRIANNLQGIVVSETVFGTRLYGNEFGSSEGLGIDLCAMFACPDGTNANDADDVDAGANELQNYPTLSSIRLAEEATTIVGSLDVPAGTHNGEYHIGAYWSPECAPLGFGPGELFLGSGLVSLSDGGEEFELELPVVLPSGGVVTATATTSNGNSSELSQCLAVPVELVFEDSFE